MERNSESIWIPVGATTYVLSWLGDSPDFSNLSGSALADCQAAWDLGRDALIVLPDPVPPSIEPDWDGFLSQFTYPGNPLYDQIATKAQAATLKSQEHWSNLRLLIMAPSNLRSKASLLGSWQYLQILLSGDGSALEVDTVNAFESLARLYYLMD